MSRGKVLGRLENYGNFVHIIPSNASLSLRKNAGRCDQTAFDDFLPDRKPDIDEVDPEVGLLNEAHLWHLACSESLQTLHRQEQIAEYLMEMQQPNWRIAEKGVENHDAEAIQKVKIIRKRSSESRVRDVKWK